MPCLLLSLCPSVSLQGHSWSVPSWEPRKQPAGVSSPCPLLIRTGERRRMDLGPISLGLLGSTLLLFCLHSHPYTHILKCHTFMFNTRWQLLIIGRHSPPLPNGESDFSVSPFISILDAPCPPSQVRCHSLYLVTSVTAFLPGLGSPCPPSQVRSHSSYLVTSELNGEVNHYQLLIWNRRGNATRPSTHCSQFSSSDYNTHLLMKTWRKCHLAAISMACFSPRPSPPLSGS